MPPPRTSSDGSARSTRAAATGITAKSITASLRRVRERDTGTSTTWSLRTRYPSRDITTATSTVSLYR